MKRLVFATCALLLFGVACRSGSTGYSCSLASYGVTTTPGADVGIASPDLGGLSVAQSFMLTADGTAVSAYASLVRVGKFATGAHTLYATIEGNDATSTFP